MAFTFFFRDLSTLNLIADHAIPEFRTKRYINIWDAGCANGPEPYTLAIILHENMGRFIFRNVKIHATDIDESDQFGEQIRSGIYQEEHIKRIPDEIRQKYFSQVEGSDNFIIHEDIRKCVEFRKHNLLSLKPIREGLNLIVCKNVLLHFKEEERVEVMKMFHKALGDGGFLVNEQTQKMPREVQHLFEPVVANARHYRKVKS